MAVKDGDGHRTGAAGARTQIKRPDGRWQKRDEKTGEFLKTKDHGEPFKGVAKEPDGRNTFSSSRPNRAHAGAAIRPFRGKLEWQGDLDAMRTDAAAK